MKFRKPIIFFGFPKNEFLFKEIKSILYKNQKIKANQIIIILSYSENGRFSNMTMLQQEFDAWGLPSLRPYLKYVIDNEVAEHNLVKWGKGQRWAVSIGIKTTNIREDMSLINPSKIVSLYIGMSESSNQKNNKR